MPIEFQCNICGTRLRTPDGTAGKKTKCPKCEYILAIPEASDSSQPTIDSQKANTSPLSSGPQIPEQTSPQHTPPPVPESYRPQQTAQSSSPEPASSDMSSLFEASDSAGDSQEWSGFESFGLSELNSHSFDESGNPYQAPLDDGPMLVPQYRAVGVSGDRLGFSQAFAMSFDSFKKNFLQFFILGCVYFVYYICSFLFMLGIALLGASHLTINLISYTNSALMGLLTLGLNLCALEIIRRGRTSISTGFSVITSFFSLLTFGILTMLLIVFVIGLPILIFILIGQAIEQSGGGDLGLMIALTLAVPWGIATSIIIGYRLLVIGPLLIVDQKVSSFQAIQLSWAVTKGNALTQFCIYLVFGIAALIGIAFTLGLGSFVVYPFSLCLTAMCYHIMWEQYRAKTPSENTSEW